jgi:hypothetical protein
MKKSIMLFVAIVMMASFTNKLMAQTQSVGALILAAGVQITAADDMHFGTMLVPTTAATVILAIDGSRTTTGTITLLGGPLPAKAGSYDLVGENNADYAITIGASTTITNGTALNDMTVDNFVCSYAALTGTLNGSGLDNFKVGATLHLANAQPVGTYSGTYNLSVDYN